MNDVEIESLLEDAGYQYSLAEGTYLSGDETDGEIMDSETVADQLEIPLDDLERWEAEQRQADATTGD